MMANMISSYFGKGIDSREIFQKLKVSANDWFEHHLNQHNVIHIMLNEIPDGCSSYEQYISRIKSRLLNDLIRQFPDAGIEKGDALWDAFNSIIEFGDGEKFTFVLDEWDYIFHQDFVTEADKKDYTRFLSVLFKDQPYVEFVYMTGILPITKYAAASVNLKTRDEIFSAMVVYGVLNYENGCVSIPNKELMDKFADMLRKEPSLGYVSN